MAKPRNKLADPINFSFAAAADAGEPTPLVLTAAADASSGDAAGETPKLRKFSMVAYTGGKMTVPGFALPVVIDLTGMRISQKSLPILRDHKLDAPVGHTDKITVGNSVRVEGSISAANDHAREITESADKGFPWQASVGAAVTKLEYVAKGETAQANGRSFSGPIYVVRQSALREISVTPVGADDQSATRIAASLSGLFPMNFEQWLAAKGFDVAKLTDGQKQWLQASFDAEQKAGAADDADDADAGKKKGKKKKAKKLAKKLQAAGIAGGPGDDDDEDEDDDVDPENVMRTIRASAAAETKRIAGVRKICAGNSELEIKAVAEGWDETKAELEMLRASRAQAGGAGAGGRTGPAIHIGGKPVTPQTIEAALCLQHGVRMERAVEYFGEPVVEAAASRQLRGIGLQFLFHEVIRAAGMYAPAGQFNDDTIRTAFEAERRLQATFPSQDFIYAAGEFSTTSLSGVLSNLANKLLLESFSAVNAVGPKFCGVRDANDFKPTNTYRLTEAGVLEDVGQDGELKHGKLSDESYSNQVRTKGKILALTRQQIINDDLGAFLQIPKLLGRASALALEIAIFTLLLANGNSYDGNALFSAAHANYQSGGTTALDIDPLTAAEQLFLNQVDSAGNPILLQARYLLVPTALKTYASQLMKEQIVVGVPANNKLKPANNPHAGKWEVLSSPYLNAQSLAGQSSTGWYLLADPLDCAVVEIAYLRGSRAPIIESAETVFNTLGMQWRAFFDFGVASQDWRGGVFSAGA